MSFANNALATAGMAVMCAILRLSADLIADFSDRASAQSDDDGAATDDDDNAATNQTTSSPSKFLLFIKRWCLLQSCCYPSSTAAATDENERRINEEETSSDSQSVLLLSKKSSSQEASLTYGTVDNGNSAALVDLETQNSSNDDSQIKHTGSSSSLEVGILPFISLGMHLLFLVYFLSATALASGKFSVMMQQQQQQHQSSSSYYYPAYANAIYSPNPLACVSAVICLGIVMNLRDFRRRRFGTFQRVMTVAASVMLLLGCVGLVAFGGSAENDDDDDNTPTKVDVATLAMLSLYTILCITECKVCKYPSDEDDAIKKGKQTKAKLTTGALLLILKPYFWPHSTATSATLNRCRAIATWACVLCSKAASIVSPLLLGRASTALTRYDWSTAMWFSAYYALARLLSSAFKEGQGLLYLFVAQSAFVELSEVTFSHLHRLSLDWHLQKKLGETIRSMDRGIGACDSLMRNVFLFLLPAIAEMILVVIIFASYFDYLPLAVAVFAFVYVYGLLTIILTLWRKKFRKQVTKSDNAYHDICTDSLMNFETVKYFTAEEFEIKRFVKSIERYQLGTVNVRASLSSLNLSQQVLLQACLATCLSLAVVSIRNRINCCVSFGCDEGNSDCCSQSNVCTGLEMGDFIAVLTYTLNIFAPLNYLGSIYNSLVMSMIDLANLSELLVENPDVTDAPDAKEVPTSNDDVNDTDTVVEFEDVRFHYPTQPDTRGLKGLSFKMKRGTVTAVVGPTGEGKTTVSRLLFRFYDVLGGAVKINGVDIRSLKQESLRSSIGVVPQNTSLFNDSIKNNIKYGKQDATDEEVMQVIEDAQLKTFIGSLTKGWDTTVGDRGLKLSGGEQQRTSIARCLLKNPPIVVLDEATSALDTVTENSIQEALDRLGNDRTVLVIAHRLGTIKNADNIIVLGGGAVAEEGTHDDLLARGGKYAELWNMQLKK